MRKILTFMLQSRQRASIPLLLASFATGYLLATLLFDHYGDQIRRLLNYLVA